MVEAVRAYGDDHFRKSDFVTVKRNVLADVEVKVSLKQGWRSTRTVGERGSRKTVTEKPNTESIVWSLGHLTLTRMIASGCRKGAIYSNWNPISKEIFGNIRAEIGRNPRIPV